VLRSGEIVGSAGGENGHPVATVSFDPGRGAECGGGSTSDERQVCELTNRFADWCYVISGADFTKLRLKRKDVAR